MNAGVVSRDTAVDDSNLWQFQRKGPKRRQQQSEKAPWREDFDVDPRIRSNGAASTSQPSSGWEQLEAETKSISQHPSWTAQNEKRPTEQKRRPQPFNRQSTDAGPANNFQGRQRNPPPEEDDIWNYPSTNGRSTPASSRSGGGAPDSGRDARASRRPGSNSFPSNRSVSQESDDPWNAQLSWAEPQANGWDEVSPKQTRSQPRQQRENPQRARAAESWDNGIRGQPEQDRGQERGQARRRDPWKQMVNQKDPVEMDRKARVRIAIACNKIVLTAFEQFCIEEQAAKRMADRQELLQVCLIFITLCTKLRAAFALDSLLLSQLSSCGPMLSLLPNIIYEQNADTCSKPVANIIACISNSRITNYLQNPQKPSLASSIPGIKYLLQVGMGIGS